MKNVHCLHLGFILFFLSSCEKEQMPYLLDNDKVQISADIVSDYGSRAELTLDGHGEFSLNDRISLLVTPGEIASSQCLNCDPILGSTGWQTDLTWREIQGDRARFTAFYPALPQGEVGASGVHIHTVSTDQRSIKEYKASDLLYAMTTSERGQPVRLDFSHCMSRLTITLYSSDGSFTDEELSAAVVGIRSYHQIAFNPVDATLKTVRGEMTTIIAGHPYNGVFHAILCPQDIAKEWRDEYWMKIQIAGQTVEYKAPVLLNDGSPFLKLDPGKQIFMRIGLKRKDEESDEKNIWTYGLHNPSVETWKYAYATEKIPGLKWDKSYGWYDCNKTDPNPGGVDSEMCWAATASNMIHWWLDRNKVNLSRYGYAGPQKYVSSTGSEVFDYYKLHFKNTANDVAAALNWFFTGRYGTTVRPGGGFFKQLLGTVPVISTVLAYKETFSQDVKKALEGKQAIGCCVQFPNRYLHSISLWGADFDSKGEVCAIYIADSNDISLEQQQEFCLSDDDSFCQTPAGIIRKPIQIKSDGVYMEGSVPGTFNFKITELYFLELMQEKWKRYFESTQ